MKFQLFHAILLLVLTSLTLSIPVDNEVNNEGENSKRLAKRYDVNTYLRSIGHVFNSSDVKRNISYSGIRKLDVYYSKRNKNGKNPVVIYIFGGSWYLGEKALYTKLGEALRDSGIITVIPNYVQFPFGDLDEMTYDISEVVKWVYSNIHLYGGDKDNIIVLGHSSGAHLTALTLLRNSLGLEPTTHSEYYVSFMPKIKRAVLLNGPYDFDLLSKKLKETGNKPENSATEAFLKAALNSDDACPTEVLKKYGNKSIQSLGADLIVLMHAEEDATVPVLSSYELLDEIERATNNPATLFLTHGYYHCGITEGVMNGDVEAQRLLIEALLREDFPDIKNKKEKESFKKDETEEKAKQEAEEKARKEAEEKARKEAEEKAKKEAEEKAKKEAEEKAKKEAEEKAKKEAENKSKCPNGEYQCGESCYNPKLYTCDGNQLCPFGLKNCNGACYSPNEYHCESGRLVYGPESNSQQKEQYKKEDEEKAKKEAEEKARKEAEEKARKEAEEKARKEAEEKAKKEAEEKARKEAEEKARKEAEEKARKEAEEKARKEAEQRSKNSSSTGYWFDDLERNAKKYPSNPYNDYWFETEDRNNRNNSPFFW